MYQIYFFLSTGSLAITACGSVSPPTVTPAAGPKTGQMGGLTAPPTSTGTSDITPVLPKSDLAIGHNRFVLGILDSANRPITDARLHLRFYTLNGTEATLQSERDPEFRGEGLGERGVYVTSVEFTKSGHWGVEVQATRPQGALPVARVAFEVQDKSRTPAVGAPAIRSRNQTTRDGKKLEDLCAGRPPCDMHDLAIGDLIGNGRPIVVYFGTPAFCTSRVCGPGLDVVLAAKKRFSDKADFVHVEIYKDPAAGTPLDTIVEWGLPSEPWLFLVDGKGTIVEKLEGGITTSEVEPLVAKLVGVTT